jgi:hypothetical protein
MKKKLLLIAILPLSVLALSQILAPSYRGMPKRALCLMTLQEQVTESTIIILKVHAVEASPEPSNGTCRYQVEVMENLFDSLSVLQSLFKVPASFIITEGIVSHPVKKCRRVGDKFLAIIRSAGLGGTLKTCGGSSVHGASSQEQITDYIKQRKNI